MLTFFLFMLIGSLVGSAFLTLRHKGLLPGKKISPIPAPFPTSGLSDPSKFLHKKYMALPKDFRPFPDDMLAPLLRMLDIKHSVDEDSLKRHFNGHEFKTLIGQGGRTLDGYYKFDWKGDCYNNHHTCQFSGYGDIYRAIDEVETAVLERRRAEALAKVESLTGGLDDRVKELTERLRTEASITKEVTKEFF